MDLADSLFSDVASNGLSPDCTTFAIMIRGYCAVGYVERAVSFFHMMRQRDMVPDTFIFDSVLDGCACRNLPGLAEEILDDMLSAGVRPSSATVAIMVRVYSASGQLVRAVEVFRGLPLMHGAEVDGRAYSALVFACLNNGDIEVALDTFESMSGLGYLASSRMYEALIEGCLRSGALERAVGLVDDAFGIAPPKRSVAGITHEGAAPRIQRRVLLDRRVVEDLLRILGRRRMAQRLAVPLAERLTAAGFEVSEDILASLERAAQQGPPRAQRSPLEVRRAEWRRWGDYMSDGSKVEAGR